MRANPAETVAPAATVPTTEVRGGAPIVALYDVSKGFGSTLANDRVSLVVVAGDVVGLVGGNGAGKSTLMRQLCGVMQPDSGRLELDGVPARFDGWDPSAAQAHGIRIVHQELSLCGNLTVAENFFLEAPDLARPVPGWRRGYRARARRALDLVFPGNGIDVDRRIEDLSIGHRQMVEIARAATAPEVRVLILDEPTSSLDLERSRQLRAFIHSRAEEGLATIFISHKLHEVVDVATQVMVLRNGRVARTGTRAEITIEAMVEAMGGSAHAALRRAHGEVAAAGPARLRITGPAVAALGEALVLHAGEIVGLAGLEGAGQKEFLHALFSGRTTDGSRIERMGEVSFVSGDRQREGVFSFWNVFANIDIGRVGQRFALAPFARAEDESAIRDAAEQLRLDRGRFTSNILDLSGGNQQKALVGRALVSDSPTILLDDPTRGVDVAAKADFYRLFAQAAGHGRLVVWLSTEDLEFLECDRVLVFSQGRILRELRREEITEDAIIGASFADQMGQGTQRDRSTERRRDWGRTLVRAAPFASLIVMLAVMMLVNHRTASVFGLDLLLSSSIALVLVALGQMFVVGGSEIDLGIGAFAGLVNVLSATLLVDQPLLGIGAILLAFIVYSLLGALIRLRHIPAIVVTLGASFVWMGTGYSLQPSPGGSSPDWLTALFAWTVPGIPTSLIIILVFALLAVAVDRAPLGVVLRGFGNNAPALVRSGWSTLRYGMIRYALASLFATVAGLVLTAVNTASDINVGGPFTLSSVAAVVIGGCTLLGGVLAPWGVVAGAVLLSLIGALLGALNVSTDYNGAVQGLLLLGVLALRTLLARREEA
ncbi:ATP-binding cassette domain-containing protein [Acidisoma sp. 7E03]